MNLLDDIQSPILEEGAPAWVVTFGDLMSLLLCFFVLLLSFFLSCLPLIDSDF